jgi:two-component system, NtrC family, sensor kinase
MIPLVIGVPVQQSRLPFVALDAEASILALNDAAAALFARPAAELIATPFAETLDPFSREKAALMVAEALADGVTYDWELNHTRPDAPPTLVTYTAWVWRADLAMPSAVAAIGRPLDAAISLAGQLAATNQQLEGTLIQLERAHAALKEAQVQLVRSEKMRALGQLVAGVAHEVNTPLAFVANNLDFLAESLQSLRDLYASYHALAAATPDLAARMEAADRTAAAAQIWADLDEILPESRDGVARIATIVQALRTFARPDDSGTQAADINSGLASTVRIARASLPRGVTIREQYGQLPLVVCNPGQINQVILNLLTNAIQAILATGEVLVSSSHIGDHVQISVSDTGVGMDEATLARLGEPFFTTRPVGSGTGLGIAISRGIVERHAGRLEFSSTPGQGTTARIILPLSPR